jgi:hypothetical protein
MNYAPRICKVKKKKTDAERLALLLWEKQVLNREAAEILGVHERTIYKWLSGERPIPMMALKLLELQLAR